MHVWLRAPASTGLLLAATVACSGPPVDLTQGLQIKDATTGWFDAGIVNGQNKLVPTITFTLKNVSDQKLRVPADQRRFRRVTEKDEWGAGFLMVAGSEGLAPGVRPGR